MGEITHYELHESLSNEIKKNTSGLQEHELKKASDTELGHVKTDGVTTETNADGVISAKGFAKESDLSNLQQVVTDNKSEFTQHVNKQASETEEGHVKIDGVTIVKNSDGAITAVGGSSGGTSGPVSAKDVVETPERVFVTPEKSAAIEVNTVENASQTIRIADLENKVDNITTTDEKVAMDAVGTAKYLSELLDNLTIQNNNGKLEAAGLKDLLATINELNFLQGVTGPIQQQINNLSGVSSFAGVFTSLVDLEAFPDPQPGQYAIVSDGMMSSYYFYYGSNWDFSHEATGATNIDISTGTTGILPKVRYEKQNAEETPFADANGKIIATNANDAIIEVFQFADSLRKELVGTIRAPLDINDTLNVTLQKLKAWYGRLANSVTNKGISTSTSNSGDEVISKIDAIPSVSINGGIKRVNKLNAVSPYDLEINLEQPFNLEDICVTLFEYVPGATGVVKYDVKFNNGDKSDFEENEFVKFDGVVSLETIYNYTLEDVSDWNGQGFMQKAVFDRSKFKSVESFLFEL